MVSDSDDVHDRRRLVGGVDTSSHRPYKRLFFQGKVVPVVGDGRDVGSTDELKTKEEVQVPNEGFHGVVGVEKNGEEKRGRGWKETGQGKDRLVSGFAQTWYSSVQIPKRSLGFLITQHR